MRDRVCVEGGKRAAWCRAWAPTGTCRRKWELHRGTLEVLCTVGMDVSLGKS